MGLKRARGCSLLPRFALLAAAVGLLASVSSCALACHEVGWVNEVVLDLGIRAGQVNTVALCFDDDVCMNGVKLTDNRWRFDVGLATPPDVVVTGIDGTGAVVFEQQLSIEWEQTEHPNGPGCSNASIARELRLE